jgi:hypothetical protein
MSTDGAVRRCGVHCGNPLTVGAGEYRRSSRRRFRRSGLCSSRCRTSPCPAGAAPPTPDDPPRRQRQQALRVRRRARWARLRGRPRRGLRIPRPQWRRQDDDHAHRPRGGPPRRRGHLVGWRAGGRPAARHLGLPTRGARPLPPDDRARPARLLRAPVRGAARPGGARGRSLGSGAETGPMPSVGLAYVPVGSCSGIELAVPSPWVRCGCEAGTWARSILDPAER